MTNLIVANETWGQTREKLNAILGAEGGRFSYPSQSDLPENGVLRDGSLVFANRSPFIAQSGATKIPAAPGYIRGREAWMLSNFGNLQEGQDATTILKDAIECAAEDTVKALILDPGRYVLASRAVATIEGVGQPHRTFHIMARGAEFVLPASNTAGGLKITRSTAFNEIHIDGLALYSDALVGVVGDPTNGIGLEIDSAIGPGDAGWGVTSDRTTTVENCTVTNTNVGRGRWSAGIKVLDAYYPFLRNNRVVTTYGQGANTGEYETGAGIEVQGYFPSLQDNKVVGSFLYGLRLTENDEFGWEDFDIQGGLYVAGIDAIRIDMQSTNTQAGVLKEPGGRIANLHCNGDRSAITVENRQGFIIDNVSAYTVFDNGSNVLYEDGSFLRLHNTRDVIVSGLQIDEGGHYTSDTDCQAGIRLTGDTSHTLITGCQIGAKGIGIINDATGDHNIVEGNLWRSQPTVANAGGGPTKRILDNTGRLRGGDVAVSATPTMTATSGAPTGYANQEAVFNIQGRTCSFNARCHLAGAGTLDGPINIVISPDAGTGFPATAGSGAVASVLHTTGFTGDLPIVAFIIVSSGDLVLQLYDQTNARITHADLNGAEDIRISGSYMIDA